MGELYLEVITPEKVIVSQKADIVVAPGTLGEFGVLPEHVAFLSGIIPGELRYSLDGKAESLAVSAGFSEVFNNRVSVLVDAAEMGHEIDVERAKLAMERAKERLAKDRGTEDIDFLRAEAALKRAIIRIKVAESAK
jgi:F-type H+-transporting ATPase subunit epsilon